MRYLKIILLVLALPIVVYQVIAIAITDPLVFTSGVIAAFIVALFFFLQDFLWRPLRKIRDWWDKKIHS